MNIAPLSPPGPGLGSVPECPVGRVRGPAGDRPGGKSSGAAGRHEPVTTDPPDATGAAPSLPGLVARAAVRRAPRAPRERQPAGTLPVARVAVDSPLPHLDRPFDYLVPAELDEAVRPGSRVRVRFAGRLVDAWVLHRLAASEHDGRLAYLERGLGDEPVLTDETTALFRAVADRWAGTFADVLRLGVPARHARAESAVPAEAAPAPVPPDPAGWARYRAGAGYLAALRDGRGARAVWNALPGEDWPARIAEAAQAVLAGGRGVLVVVPDVRDAARVDRAMQAALGKGAHVLLSADLGPEARYRRWLAVRRGTVRAVVGTRSAVFAPVADLGLVVVWDDGDDLHAEPRAPYPHARDVAVLRASMTGAALLVGGFGRTAEAALLVESGWAQPVVADRAVLREAAPRIVALGDDVELERDPVARSARLPALAFRTARTALAAGHPVLVQVPRRGYVPSLACARDRTPARCRHCAGPLVATGRDGLPSCRWCGRPAADWQCPRCGGTRLRAMVVGSSRTAEELGRAFPGVVLRVSAGDSVLPEVPPGPALVVATPGAEPVAPDGYGAALLLDGWALLSRPDLRAAEETLRRWSNAAALVRPDGTVIVSADAGLPVVQALLRWDPGGHAERELADRRELHFPPVSRMAALVGAPADVAELLSLSQLPASAEELGSVPLPP
ncbi:MAG: primosomal protein N', partial [Actinobacteria bacterium]|nr:primosomal protein N' [Actinomycetota bacterium]